MNVIINPARGRGYALLARETQNPEEQDYSRQKVKCDRILLAGLLCSAILNLFLILARPHASSGSDVSSKYGNIYMKSELILFPDTYIAHLAEGSAVAWTSMSPYFGEDETIADQLWENISVDNGTVALSDSYAAAMGLPVSQRFPWDQEKGLYLLNGFHSMHCLVRWPQPCPLLNSTDGTTKC